MMTPRPDKVRAVRDAFLEVYAADLGGGRVRRLEQYQALFPGHEADIAEELALLEDSSADEDAPGVAAEPPPVPTADDATPPERIGPYRILSVLGEGGMGTVFLAEQKEPVRRRVALKLIKLGMDSKQVLARFEAERQALAMMNHDNIARVFEAGTTERGQPYFVMEHVEGIPITDYCDRHKLTIQQRIELFQQACAGVQHAHQKGVIHRDLKPSNVLVTRRDERAIPKIIDFGLARATDHQLVDQTLFTEQGQILGTPEYMSPEQAGFDAQGIDTRTDIYSLGVMLYELLAGELPFSPQELRAAGMLEIQRKIREDQPPKPSTKLSTRGDGAGDRADRRRTTLHGLTRQLRGDLDWIVLKAMAKEPERRYESATGMAMDLGRYLEHEPVLAGPPSTVYRVRKFVRRHRVQLLAAALVFVTAIVGAAVAAVYAIKADEQTSIARSAVIDSELRLARSQMTAIDQAAHYTSLTFEDGRAPTLREIAAHQVDGRSVLAALPDPLLDPWGRQYRVESGEPAGTWWIRSDGPDRSVGTRDDLRIQDPVLASNAQDRLRRIFDSRAQQAFQRAQEAWVSGSDQADAWSAAIGAIKAVDPWNNPIHVRRDRDTLVASSAGPDEREGTSDDLLCREPLLPTRVTVDELDALASKDQRVICRVSVEHTSAQTLVNTLRPMFARGDGSSTHFHAVGGSRTILVIGKARDVAVAVAEVRTADRPPLDWDFSGPSPEAQWLQAWAIAKTPGLKEADYRWAPGARAPGELLRGGNATLNGVALFRLGCSVVGRGRLPSEMSESEGKTARDRLEDALTHLREAERRESGASNPTNVAFLAMTLRRLGRIEQAESERSRLRELMKDPKRANDEDNQAFLHEVEAFFHLEKLFEEHRLVDEVVFELRRNRELSPELRETALTLARARRDDPDVLNHQAWAVVDPDGSREGNRARALQLARAAVEAQERLAVEADRARRPAGAAKPGAGDAQVVPEAAIYRNTLAWALSANGLDDEARAASVRALQLAPPQEMETYLGYLDRLDPPSAKLLEGLDVDALVGDYVSFSQSEWHRATLDVKSPETAQWTDAAGTSAPLRVELAEGRLRAASNGPLHDEDPSRLLFDLVLQRDADGVQQSRLFGLRFRGALYLHLRQVGEDLAWCPPGIPDQLNQRAWPIVDPDGEGEGDRARALTFARAAVGLEPDSAAYRHTLAWALFANGLEDEARVEFVRALELAKDRQKYEWNRRDRDRIDPPPPSLLAGLSAEMLVANYVPHGTLVARGAETLQWTDAAGRSWMLRLDRVAGVLRAGEDCPHYNPALPEQSTMAIVFRRDAAGQYLAKVRGLRFRNELYERNVFGFRAGATGDDWGRILGVAGEQRERRRWERLVVLEVLAGSAAESAGLRFGDIITSIAGLPASRANLGRARQERDFGDLVPFEVRRGEETLRIDVPNGAKQPK